MALRSCANPQEFPRIAKEMGFYFSLRRGRVDWNKIDAIDVDRLVNDRELSTLQENLVNIVNYNIENEYDVKILDQNFVKLFKLAQLAVDYLMYSEQHIYNCVVLAEEQLNTYIKKIQALTTLCKKKNEDLKNAKRKLKEAYKMLEVHSQHSRHGRMDVEGNTQVLDNTKCMDCQRALCHYPDGHTAEPIQTHSERDQLQLEIKELKERLNGAERQLQSQPEPAVCPNCQQAGVAEKEEAEETARREDTSQLVTKTDIENLLDIERRMLEEEYKKKLEMWNKSQQYKYTDELSALKTAFLGEIQELKQTLTTKSTPSSEQLLENIHQQEEKIHSLKEQLSGQLSPNLEYVQTQISAQERIWKSTFSQLEEQYNRQLQVVAEQLRTNEAEGQKNTTKYENIIQELLKRAENQDKMLQVQGEQIKQLTEMRSVQVIQESKQAVQLPHSGNTLSAPVEHVFTIPRRPAQRDAALPYKAPKQDDVKLSELGSEDSSIAPSPTPLAQPSVPPRPGQVHGEHTVRRIVTHVGDAWLGDRVVEDHVDGPASDSEHDDSVSVEEETEEDTEEDTEEETEVTEEEDEENKKPQANSQDRDIMEEDQRVSHVKEDLRDTLDRKLRELGIDPEWTGIPTATYKQKMATLHHHQNIAAKRYLSYFNLRKKLADILERKIPRTGTHIQKQTKRKDRNTTVAADIHNPRLDKLMGHVKSKALNVLKRSSKKSITYKKHFTPSSRNTPSQRSSSQESLTRTKHMKLGSQESMIQSKTNLSSGQRIASNLKTSRTNSQEHLNQTRPGSSTGHKVSRENRAALTGSQESLRQSRPSKSTGAAKSQGASGNIKTITNNSQESSKPTKPANPFIRSTPGKGQTTKEMAQRGFSSVQVKKGLTQTHGGGSEGHEHRPLTAQQAKQSMYGGVYSEQTPVKIVTSTPQKDVKRSMSVGRAQLKVQQIGDSASADETTDSSIEQRLPESNAQSQTPRNTINPSIDTTKAMEMSVSTYQSPNKSVLKGPATLRNAVKKKVLFVDQEDTPTKLGNPNNSEDIAAGRSPVMVGAAAAARELRKVDTESEESDTDSDWGLTSENNDTVTATDGTNTLVESQNIRLSTRQSNKIAEISKSIEKQLSISRNRPAGGVDTMFPADQSQSSFFSSSSLASSIHETSVTSTSHQIQPEDIPVRDTPIPKPRQQQSKKVLPPSDWDLEDFDEIGSN